LLVIGRNNNNNNNHHNNTMKWLSSFPSLDGIGPLSMLGMGLLGHLSATWSLSDWEQLVNGILLPLYRALVLSYLALRIYHVVLEPLFDRRGKVPSTVTKANNTNRGIELEDDDDDDDTITSSTLPPPINITGRYQLVENENFEELLAVQGIPWALRSAANRARPTHKFIHRGHSLTIQIQGIIESETKYMIGGKKVTETAVRGRQFHDTVTYLEDGTGIQTFKRAIHDGYTVRVCRRFSPDKSKLTMTSTVEFDDKGKDRVECRQLFERIDN